MSQYIYDIINNAKKTVQELKYVTPDKEYIVVFDTHMYSYYLASMVSLLAKGDDTLKVSVIYENCPRDDFFELFMEQNFPHIVNRYEHLSDYQTVNQKQADGDDRSKVFIFFTNARDNRYSVPEAAQERALLLRSYLEYASTLHHAQVLSVEHIPAIDTLPGEISGISEREYETICSGYPENSLQKVLLKLEDVCREYVEKVRVNVLRMDTMFGPHIPDDSPIAIQAFIEEIIHNHTLTVSADARTNYYSASYIRDALIKTILLASKEVEGNIFNCSSFHFSLFEIAFDLYTLFDNLKIDFKVVGESSTRIQYHILNARKMKLLTLAKTEPKINSRLRRAVHVTALSEMQDYEHYVTEKINVYYGKMNRIRQMELELLAEVDKICKENNIKYFLTAGSMLGAVRHKGFIPWDDDMDIGMMPEDYKKFVKLCPQYLSDRYSYQTTSLEPASLYIHDKIRIRDTVFSTRYASQYAMQRGVYIDIFVYYKTSDKPRAQRRHIWQIKFMRQVLAFRWRNRPKKGIINLWTHILTPITGLIPTPFFRNMYFRVLEKYEKKNTHYLLDGTGFNLDKVGAFPKEWFEDTIEGEFCGYKFPILKRYDDFLRHWYGEKYMELLPFSDRKSVHDVITIDLGHNVIEDTSKQVPRTQDFRGELYEK